MASSSTPAAVREMQKDLEVQANALSKIQKGTRSPYSHESPSLASASNKSYLTSDLRCSSSRRHREEPPGPQAELELLNDGANVYKLIGPVLVKQDLAEAKANVKKRIEYISAELKRMDRALKDLEDKQNSKKESIFKLQQRMQAVQANS
ncbi:hypothetical protein C2845_PM12G08080 [Panicum miliaceum]|uniref:Prefoldin subunit 6 n=1 Tax=Panicum miliaceum TaxID=4540 RepID=A0A3L6QJ56_PANMI|nr:hypothetical protein C2845_PM12G08080 [Panicum miliaceum]